MHYQLERYLCVEVFDRRRVLLELFAQRASSREGKLQVELALLQYEVPLLREWIHEADVGERPGFMAGRDPRFHTDSKNVGHRKNQNPDHSARIAPEGSSHRIAAE